MIDDIVSILDVPGAFLRNSLAGRNPLQGITTDEDRTSGRALLEAWGLLDPNEEGLDWGDVAGFGVDVLADPLNLLGGFGAWKGAKWLSKAGKAGDALPAVSQAVDPVADVVETLGRRQLHPYQTMQPEAYQVAPPASEIIGRLPAEPPAITSPAASVSSDLLPPMPDLDAIHARAQSLLNDPLPKRAPSATPKAKPLPPPEYEMTPYPVEGFYSRLEEAAKALPNTAKGIKAESLKNLLQKAPEGFSAEEWKLYGMDDLVGRGGRIGKEDILRHLEANRPGLSFQRTTPRAEWSQWDYSGYSPPGFLDETYVEEGLRVPVRSPDPLWQPVEYEHFLRGDPESRKLVADRLRAIRQHPAAREVLEQKRKHAVNRVHALGKKRPLGISGIVSVHPDEFRLAMGDWSNHAFSEPNVIGWRRAGTHVTPKGEKVHVAQEFQSDAHQSGVTNPSYGSKVAPLKKEWTDPLIRRHIQEAVSRGADRVGFTTGDTAAQFTGGQLSGQRAFYGAADLEGLRAEGAENVRKLIRDIEDELATANDLESAILKDTRDKLSAWLEAGQPLKGKVAEDARTALRQDKQLIGDASDYIPSPDAKIPTAVEKYLKQRGWDTKLERDFIVGPTGEHYPIFSFKITDKMREDLAKRGQPLFSVGLPLGLGLGAGALATDPLGMGEGV